MKAVVFAVLLALAPAAFAQTYSARSLMTATSKEVASFRQDVLVSGEMSSTLRIGPLTTSDKGFGVSRLAVDVPTSPVAPMPRIAVGNPTTQSAAMEAASSWVTSHLPTYRTAVSAWLQQRGLSIAVFNFYQEIMLQTDLGPKRKAIAFNATIDVSGRPNYGAPKIVDPDPTIVEAIYTPLRAMEGLPADWKYPDAGTVKWRVLNKNFAPLTAWATINVNGAFDQPPGAEDPETKVRCLMDSRYAGCTTQPDVRDLMSRSGSSYALVSYVRELEPEYTTNESTGESTPRSVISVDERLFDCTNYTNRGHYGFVLSMVADQYLAQPAEPQVTYKQVAQFAGRGISPTEPYEKSVSAAVLAGTHPDTVILSPVAGDESLWSRTDAEKMRNVIYVAPVVNAASDGMNTITFDGEADMDARILTNSGGVKEYYVGTVGDNYWGGGTYDRTIRFDVAHPSLFEEFTMPELGFDDYMSVAVNGTVVYIGPYGGNTLFISTTESSPTQFTECSKSGATWTCKVPNSSLTETFMHCTAPMGEGESTYTCYNGCPKNYVQTKTAPGGIGDGCYWGDLKTNWRFPVNLDLKPYLVAGPNEIALRTLVYDKGEGWVRLKTRMCGASLNLADSTPAVPAGAGESGVSQNLQNMGHEGL